MSMPTTEYPYQYPVVDRTAEKLSSASKVVKIVFDVFAVLILIVGALATVGLIIAALAEHQSYLVDADNLFDESGAYIIGAIVAPIYTALGWATIKFYAIVAGYVSWRTK